MQIRVAQLEDIETLFDIRTSVTENHQSLAELAKLGVTPDSIAQMLQTRCCAWLAEIDGEAAGFSMANAIERMIFALFVRPTFAGRGVGRALIQQAEAWLWSQGALEIWLSTGNNPKLRAYGFYQHLGWTVTDDRLGNQVKFVKRKIKLSI
ncbi:MAG TPA: GNAT family N-acetyltransferase [Trichocoleus sp.]|jgi:GNAT superfamily N-acetyltransferase